MNRAILLALDRIAFLLKPTEVEIKLNAGTPETVKKRFTAWTELNAIITELEKDVK